MEENAKYDRGCPIIDKENTNIPVCRKGNSCKLDVTDWLQDIPNHSANNDIVEIRFKNTRKAFYQNVNHLGLQKGDLVAVEASPGHDIGVVSLVGNLVHYQLSKNNISSNTEFLKIYRKAKLTDIEKWEEAIELDNPTMLAARKIASEQKLNMKIGDVEYQGDKTKAIFYYIAEERVDFRELIKILAERFKIRIEMKQIGARQEAGRIGGIGPCGRELCCSTHISNFVSVTTNSARLQDLSLNPQKLAGQCGKLKCCLNYEVDTYVDARANMPNTRISLQTEAGTAYHFKSDIFRGIMWYSFDKNEAVNIVPVPIEMVKDIIEKNNNNIIVPALIPEVKETEKSLDFENVVGQDRLDRFDGKQDNKKKKKKRKNKNKKFKSSNANPNKANNQ